MTGVQTCALPISGLFKLIPKKKLSLLPDSRFYFERRRLLDRGLLKIETIRLNQKTIKICKLTKKGEEKLAEFLLSFETYRKFGRWDGNWRILIFDVSEKRRTDREQIRYLVKQFGFFPYHKNVWIYPYASAKKLCDYLSLRFKSEKIKIDLIRAGRFTKDAEIAQYFNLK